MHYYLKEKYQNLGFHLVYNKIMQIKENLLFLIYKYYFSIIIFLSDKNSYLFIISSNKYSWFFQLCCSLLLKKISIGIFKLYLIDFLNLFAIDNFSFERDCFDKFTIISCTKVVF